MRIAALTVAALLLAGCAAAGAAPEPTGVPDAPILLSESGILRPIDNGGRVALRGGYATVRLWPSPQDMDPDLQVSLFDPAGRPLTADVSVVYQMLDMDHGTETVNAVLRDGVYRMRLSLGMAGAWRLILHARRDGVDQTITLVLPWVGL